MRVCNIGLGEYCLYGYKFDKGNPFEESGHDAKGPKKAALSISYSFQEINGLLTTHAENDLTSLSFDELIDCAKMEIRNALTAWSGIANITFNELEENSNSDIRIFVADMGSKRSAVGFPNFPVSPCNDIGGNLIINSRISGYNCSLFYALMLHETGHVLGLGHVNSDNIMNPEVYKKKFDKLQSGDSLGIVQIYGESSRGLHSSNQVQK